MHPVLEGEVVEAEESLPVPNHRIGCILSAFRSDGSWWRSNGSSIVQLLFPDVRANLIRQHFTIQPRFFQQSVNSAFYT